MSKMEKQAEYFFSKFKHSVNYELLLKSDQITNSKLFFLNLLCSDLLITPVTMSKRELYNTYENGPTAIKQNYGLAKKIEQILPLNLDINSRLCYEIVKFYYLPLNKILDEALSSVDNLDEKFSKFKEDFKQQNEGYKELGFLLKQADKMFGEVSTKIVLPNMKGINSLHSVIDLLKVYQNSISDSDIFTQYIKTEQKEIEQNKKMLFAKKLSAFLKTNYLFSDINIKDVTYDIEEKYDDDNIIKQFIGNRIGLLLKEINENQEFFIKEDLSSDMSILYRLLNKIKYVDDSIYRLNSLGNKNIEYLVSQIDGNDKEEYVKEFFQGYGDKVPQFRKILNDYENGAKKLFLFDLKNSGIKVDRFIDLNKQEFTQEDLNKLFSIIKYNGFNIQELAFKRGETVPISLFEALKDNKTLSSLSFEFCKFEVKVLEEIKDEEGSISKPVGGVHSIAEMLSQNSKIKSLDLTGIRITDKEIAIIADALKQNKTLKKLDLSSSRPYGSEVGITTQGIIKLAEALKQNDTLEELILSSALGSDDLNNINEDGMIALAAALKVNKGLRIIDLSHNKTAIVEQGVIALADALKQNKTLQIIDLKENVFISDTGLQELFEALEQNKTLKEMDLSSNFGLSSITNIGMKKLAQALRVNKTLEKLYTYGYGTENLEGVEAVMDSLKFNEGLKAIDSFSRDLDIGTIKKVAATIKVNKTLEKIAIMFLNDGDQVAQEIAQALEHNKTLKDISLIGPMSDKGLIFLALAIKNNKGLEKLELRGNYNCTHEGWAVFAEALKENKKLQHIDLSINASENEGTIYIAEALKENNTLKYVDLSNSEITDKGAIALAEALKVNRSVQYIDLSHNKVTDKGGDAFSEALKVNRSVQYIDLSSNKVTNEHFLIEVFENNDTLTSCYIPVQKEQSLLIDILNKKYNTITKELQTIKFAVNQDDIISYSTRLLQLSKLAQFLSIPENTLDSYKEKVLGLVQYYVPSLISRCELLHNLYLMEKGNKENTKMEGSSYLKKLHTSIFYAFDQIIYKFLESQFNLGKDIFGVNALFSNSEDIIVFLHLLENSKILNLNSAVDMYKGMISCDETVQFKVVPLIEEIISSDEYKDNGGLDDEKDGLNYYQSEIKKRLVNEVALKNLLITEIRKIISAQEAGEINIAKILTNQSIVQEGLVASVISSTVFNKLINSTDEELSNLIVKSKLNVDIKNEEGLSLISAAIYAKKPELVKVLLKHGASLATGEYGAKHPLVALVMLGDQELADAVCIFANQGELTSELGRSEILLSTPLHLALQQGKIGIAKLFLEHGADPKLKKNGVEPLTKNDLKNLLPNYEVDSIKLYLKENHADIYDEMSKKHYDTKKYLSAIKEYDLEDINTIEQNWQEVIHLAGEDSSCLIS